jgi:hypothetical protein
VTTVTTISSRELADVFRHRFWSSGPKPACVAEQTVRYSHERQSLMRARVADYGQEQR